MYIKHSIYTHATVSVQYGGYLSYFPSSYLSQGISLQERPPTRLWLVAAALAALYVQTSQTRIASGRNIEIDAVGTHVVYESQQLQLVGKSNALYSQELDVNL